MLLLMMLLESWHKQILINLRIQSRVNKSLPQKSLRQCKDLMKTSTTQLNWLILLKKWQMLKNNQMQSLLVSKMLEINQLLQLKRETLLTLIFQIKLKEFHTSWKVSLIKPNKKFFLLHSTSSLNRCLTTKSLMKMTVEWLSNLSSQSEIFMLNKESLRLN